MNPTGSAWHATCLGDAHAELDGDPGFRRGALAGRPQHGDEVAKQLAARSFASHLERAWATIRALVQRPEPTRPPWEGAETDGEVALELEAQRDKRVAQSEPSETRLQELEGGYAQARVETPTPAPDEPRDDPDRQAQAEAEAQAAAEARRAEHRRLEKRVKELRDTFPLLPLQDILDEALDPDSRRRP